MQERSWVSELSSQQHGSVRPVAVMMPPTRRSEVAGVRSAVPPEESAEDPALARPVDAEAVPGAARPADRTPPARAARRTATQALMERAVVKAADRKSTRLNS